MKRTVAAKPSVEDTERQELGLLARLVLLFAVVAIAAGAWWHGVTLGSTQRVLHQLAERPGGPMSFRFILQPCMAAVAAIHDGRRDARLGHSPYLWTILRKPHDRVERLREGLNATARIILLGVAMDVVYQAIVLQRFYPVEALIIALALAFVPYVLLRGIVLRIARRWRASASTHQA